MGRCRCRRCRNGLDAPTFGRKTAMVSLPVMWPAMWRPLFALVSHYLPKMRRAVLRIPKRAGTFPGAAKGAENSRSVRRKRRHDRAVPGQAPLQASANLRMSEAPIRSGVGPVHCRRCAVLASKGIIVTVMPFEAATPSRHVPLHRRLVLTP